MENLPRLARMENASSPMKPKPKHLTPKPKPKPRPTKAAYYLALKIMAEMDWVERF